jgi:hypothetical protein
VQVIPHMCNFIPTAAQDALSPERLKDEGSGYGEAGDVSNSGSTKSQVS